MIEGDLVITASKTNSFYKLTKIDTKKKVEFEHGVFEAIAKPPTGKVLWRV